MTQRRIVSIFLPHFAIQRWRSRHYGIPAPAESEPVVLARQGAHGPVIHGVNAIAAKLGMKRGARVTDMRALVPAIRVEDAEEGEDEKDLARLSHWARRWCPWTRTDDSDGLLLDTTGSDHLWGGEEAMLDDMARAFAAAGLTIRAAVAPTTGAAWALARYAAKPRSMCTEDDLAEMLALLPVAALRIDARTVVLLERLGLKSVGAVADVPRAALVRRFRRDNALSANPVLRLDQAMGRLAEPLMAEEPPPLLRAMRRLAEPIGELESVRFVLAELTGDVVRRMQERGAGARRLRLTGFRVSGGVSTVEVATSRGSRETAHLTKLFDGKLETLDPGFGFEVMTLDVLVHEELDGIQKELTGEDVKDVELFCLIDRLNTRFGPAAVTRPVARGSHIPERAEILAPARAQDAAEPVMIGRKLQRPLRLLRQPEEVRVLYSLPDGPPAQFVWRRKTHRIDKSEGPERIAPEWWREKSTARLRDYYRIEDSEGRRYWIFRQGLPGDGRGGLPLWFIHGLDA
ncbi:Y-family DNA polymerase [Oricola cellulosilytica]|uniref:DNA polymerase Y family protein n=1 Tax=Oricola cellulosilytica TaxID=1429082 RepID=A0A4R0PDQ3_9HYPH|nr:DNA polymerase Y family protein [Oricola cellulosilytica]TCD15907.1 DNA polymerase Y family protein [Oricola cellulosilytica]